MKALITGATGFLGSRLVHGLLSAGHRVAILVRGTASFGQLQGVLPELDVHVIDDRPDGLQQLLQAVSPDVVFHLATAFARDHRGSDLDAMLDANIILPLRLIDAMARAGFRRLINTGSAWQFFEAQSYRPVCLHSATKEAFAALLQYYVDVDAIDCITLMMHDSYGSHDPRRKIFSLLREHVGKTEPLRMSGGEQMIDLIHVDDAVAAYLHAAQRLMEHNGPARHEQFSLSGGDPRRLREVVEMFMDVAEISLPIEWGGRPYHAREVMQTWTGGQRLPGWQPRVELARGLRELASEVARRPAGVSGG